MLVVAFVAALLGLASAVPAAGDEIRVAVASNFADAMREIAGRFEETSGHRVTLAFGSTGKHYAQIKHGAPFDVFFAADVQRPRRLEEEGAALPGTRITYAVGKVVLWSSRPDYVDSAGEVLGKHDFRHLALANPRLAPYGKAAQEILESRGLWGSLQSRLVRGENIAQTFQFVKTGNAELGFVAWSQIKRPRRQLEGSWWEIPPDLYGPIEQQAVLLKDGAVARAFLSFVRGEEALQIIRSFGYEAP